MSDSYDNLPEHYHRKIDGMTLAELLRQRDSVRKSKVLPAGFKSMAQFEREMRSRINRWQVSADDHKAKEQMRYDAQIVAKAVAEKTVEQSPTSDSQQWQSVTPKLDKFIVDARAELEQRKAEIEARNSGGQPQQTQAPQTQQQPQQPQQTSGPLGGLYDEIMRMKEDAKRIRIAKEEEHEGAEFLARAEGVLNERRDKDRVITNIEKHFHKENVRYEKEQDKSDREAKKADAKAVQQAATANSREKLDTLQAGLDVAGVADPTPLADGTNALISVGRMFTEPSRFFEHGGNALISAASMIPYVGDAAKVLKLPKLAAKLEKVSSLRATKKLVKAAEGKKEERATESGKQLVSNIINNITGGGGGQPPNQPPGSGGVTPEPDDDGNDPSQNAGSASQKPTEQEQKQEDGRRTRAAVFRTSSDGRLRDSVKDFLQRELPTAGGLDWQQRQQSELTLGIADTLRGFGKLSQATEKVTGPFGKLGGKIFEFSAQFVEFANAYINKNDQVINSLEGLREKSGQMAAVFARRDIEQRRRDRERGDALAGPTANLVAEQDQLKDTQQRLTIEFEKFGLIFRGLGNQIANTAVNAVEENTGIMAKAIATMSITNNLLQTLTKIRQAPESPGAGFLRDLADGRYNNKAPYMGFDKAGYARPIDEKPKKDKK